MTALVPVCAQVVSDDPDTQVAQVISIMQGYASADSTDPAVLADAEYVDLTGQGEPISDVFYHVQSRMRFVRDEETALPFTEQYEYPIVETLVRPSQMAALDAPRGDCDDYAMYGAALLAARGVPTSFVTVAADPHTPDAYSHVYLAAYPQTGPYAGQRIPLDLSHGSYPGWETDAVINGKRAEWPVTPSGSAPGQSVLPLALTGLAAWGIYRLWRGR